MKTYETYVSLSIWFDASGGNSTELKLILEPSVLNASPWRRARIATCNFYSLGNKNLRALWWNVLLAVTLVGRTEFPWRSKSTWDQSPVGALGQTCERAHVAGTDAGTPTCYCLWALKHCLVWWRRGQRTEMKANIINTKGEMTTSKRKCHCGLCNLSLLGTGNF